MTRVDTTLVIFALIGAPIASACRESRPPAIPPSSPRTAEPPAASATTADGPRVEPKDDATTPGVDTRTVVAEDARSAAPPADVDGAPDDASAEAAAGPATGPDGAEARVGSADSPAVGLTDRDPGDRCAAFVGELAPNLEAWIERPLTAKEKRCRVLAKRDDLPVIVFEIEELPALEGPWSPSRLAVRSGATWYVLDLASHGTQLLKLVSGPWERAFHFEVAREEWEPGSNVGKRRIFYACRLPAEPDGAPRCAERDVAYKYKPLAREADPEDWVADVRFTADGLQLMPIKGRVSADRDKPAAGEVTLDAFLSKGQALRREDSPP